MAAMARELHDIRQLEELLLSGEARAEAELERLLAPSFLEFGASGRIWSRDEAIRELRQERSAERTIDNFQARRLAPGVVLATYQVRRFAKGESVAAATLRSSVWVDEGEGWQLLFHQGTGLPL
ncbi:MAG TPA: DUF4440 domain-containing protein [Allosphingosinicella sp.]|nr:DUF4440 domain-containing protein [Allosphingosinicella sp.]